MFVALWPDTEVRRCLADLVRACVEQIGGRPVDPEKLHMTVAFLGDVVDTQIAAVCACMDRLPIPRTNLSIDRLGFWPRNGIVWAGSRTPDPALQECASDLRERLARLGFRVERRPFSPHVTLLRRAKKRPRVAAPRIDWPVSGLVLARSRLLPSGSEYEVVRRWDT